VPIYEYESKDPERACEKCRHRFEIIQGVSENPLSTCPSCGNKIKRVISWCRAAVTETPPEQARIEGRIAEYERQGMWSHAAELADKHSEKSKDQGLKMRALEDYRRAGYDTKTLEKHAKENGSA